MLQLLLPCCKVCFNFYFQSARVSSTWSIRHSEKSVTTPSGKTEETRFQGSTNRVETSCQLTKDSGYVQCHSWNVFSTLPPIPISARLAHPPSPFPIPHSTSHIPHPTSHIPHPTSHIPHPISPLVPWKHGNGVGSLVLWEMPNCHDISTQSAQFFALNKITKQNIQNRRSIRQMYTVLWLSVEEIYLLIKSQRSGKNFVKKYLVVMAVGGDAVKGYLFCCSFIQH